MLDVHPAIYSGYGLVEAPLSRVIHRFGNHRRADQSTMSVLRAQSTVAETLEYLDVRTTGATRLALLELGSWTAILTNHRNGSDFSDHQYWAGRMVGARTVRVVDSEARWKREGRRRIRLSWEMRSFELHRPDNEPIRVITNANDGGRWTFFTLGDPLPFEADAPYEADDKRDRFSRAQLHAILDALGPGPLTRDRLLVTPRFALLREQRIDAEWQARIDAEARTLDE